MNWYYSQILKETYVIWEIADVKRFYQIYNLQKKMVHKEPKSFDEVNIINVKNKPSPSIKIESAKNLPEEKNLFNER